MCEISTFSREKAPFVPDCKLFLQIYILSIVVYYWVTNISVVGLLCGQNYYCEGDFTILVGRFVSCNKI